MSSLLLAATAAAVTPVPTVDADQALINAETFYKVARPKPKPCTVAVGNNIVVCPERVDPATQYVPSDVDDGVPDDGGVPRAPDVSSPLRHGMVGASVVMHGCFIPPCPKPMPLIIDLKSIPEAPAGSDADEIAKGEMAPP